MEETCFPRFGRVAIVDDKLDEVRKIQNILAEKGVPYIFYDYQDMLELDIKKVDGIRLLFLDIRLEDGTSEEKNLLTVLASTVERIIPIKNGPYAIILWTNEFGMKDKVIEYLNNNLDDSETTRPSYIGAIDKKEFISKSSSCLEEKLTEYYNSQNMLAFLAEIENNVMTVPANVVKMITYSFVNDANNEELEKLFLRFARTEKANCDSAIDATKTVLRQVADLIRDRYTEIVADTNLVETLAKLWSVDFSDVQMIEDMIAGNKIEQSAIINTVLNVNTYSEETDNVPGKVYKHTDETLRIKPEVLKLSTFNGNELSFKQMKNAPIETELEPIEVDITPSCDYAQGKNHMLRTLYGYIVFIGKKADFSSEWADVKYGDKIKKQVPDYIYVSPMFIINGRLCALLVNTKLMDLKEREYGGSLEYMFRLNDDITNEIRKKTGEMISRLGINSL